MATKIPKIRKYPIDLAYVSLGAAIDVLVKAREITGADASIEIDSYEEYGSIKTDMYLSYTTPETERERLMRVDKEEKQKETALENLHIIAKRLGYKVVK
jgi:hypothetical protein